MDKEYNIGKRFRNIFGITCLVGASIAASYVVGSLTGLDKAKVTDARYADVNEDGRPDMVLRLNDGRKVIFLGQEDGTYKQFSEVNTESRDSLDKKIEGINTQAEALFNSD